MKRPFIFVVIPILLGIVFCYYIKVSIFIVSLLLVLSIIVNLIRLRHDNSIYVGLLVTLFLLGIFIAEIKVSSRQLIKFTSSSVELEGTIEETKDITEAKGKYIISIHSIKNESVDKRTSEKIILNIIGSTKLNIGDRIKFNAILEEPLSNTNPKLYNYKLSLLSDNIYATATIREHSILDISKPKLNILLRAKIGFINKIEQIFDQYLTDKNSSLMKSILIGKYSYLGEDDIQKFKDLGIIHIIAVSGLHIGILTVLFLRLFSFIGINRKLSIVATIILIWLYAYFIGNPVSVLRSNITFTILLLSQLWAKPYDSVNTLFFAFLVLILINPFFIFDVGFQLSFITTFFIIYLSPKIRRVFHSKGSNILESVSAILSAQMGVLPVQTYYFNRIPVVSVVANLLIVPMFTICLVLSIVLIPFSFISDYISTSIGIIINSILNLQFIGTEILNHFPVLNIRLPSPSLIEMGIYYFLIFTIFDIINVRKIKREIIKVLVMYFILLIFINVLSLNYGNSLSIEFIDVGQGDSILLRTKSGNYLIDTGGNTFGDFDIGENIVLPYLEKHGVFKLKGAFISHYHEDHCKSLPYLMDNMTIENIYLPYTKPNNLLYENIKDKANEKGIPINILTKGDRLKVDVSTNILVIGPDDRMLKSSVDEDNELSLVLLLQHYNNTMLFTGDIEDKGEYNIIETLNNNVDLLKVPHHGSNTSSSVDFLSSIKPNTGIISVGRNNIYGHPSNEVVDRYKNNNIDIYRTDKSGLINVTLDKDNFYIRTFIRDKADLIYISKHYGLDITLMFAYYGLVYMMIKYFVLIQEENKKIEL